MKPVALIFLAATVSFSVPGRAESLRCENDLVNVRDFKASVLQKCGEPFFTEAFCKPTDQVYAPCQVVEEWAYNPGPGQFITILRFEGGVVTSIRFGGRVQ